MDLGYATLQVFNGLVNGAFYALLSLGLAVIFGMLRVVNFAHGAFYMLGAFAAYLLQLELGIGFWPALVLAPAAVALVGIAVERLLLRRLYGLDPLYGFLLTFGLTLLIQDGMRVRFGLQGQPYATPTELGGSLSLGAIAYPAYRLFVIAFSLAVCGGLVRDRADEARDGRARLDRTSRPDAGSRHQRGPLGHRDVRVRDRARRTGRRAGCANAERVADDGRRAGDPHLRRRGHRWYGVDRRGGGGGIRRRRAREPRSDRQSGPGEHPRVRADGGRAPRAARRSLWLTRGAMSGRYPRIAMVVGSAVVALVLPRVIYSVLALDILLWALFAMSVDLLVGYVGLLSFGHAAFWGGAAYVAALLARDLRLAFPLAALAGVLAAMALAVPVGSLSIRRRGIYFAMVTLAFAQMLFYLVNELRGVTGGENGVQGVPRLLWGVSVTRPGDFYYAALPLVLLGYLAVYRVTRSPFGHVLAAIRDNEPRAQALGYPTPRYKLVPFVLSAGIAGA